MADYCAQCSVDMFGSDTGDHRGLSTAADTAKGLYALVICEGCGMIQVDHEGKCVTRNCMVDHRTGNPRIDDKVDETGELFNES